MANISGNTAWAVGGSIGFVGTVAAVILLANPSSPPTGGLATQSQVTVRLPDNTTPAAFIAACPGATLTTSTPNPIGGQHAFTFAFTGATDPVAKCSFIVANCGISAQDCLVTYTVDKPAVGGSGIAITPNTSRILGSVIVLFTDDMADETDPRFTAAKTACSITGSAGISEHLPRNTGFPGEGFINEFNMTPGTEVKAADCLRTQPGVSLVQLNYGGLTPPGVGGLMAPPGACLVDGDCAAGFPGTNCIGNRCQFPRFIPNDTNFNRQVSQDSLSQNTTSPANIRPACDDDGDFPESWNTPANRGSNTVWLAEIEGPVDQTHEDFHMPAQAGDVCPGASACVTTNDCPQFFQCVALLCTPQRDVIIQTGEDVFGCQGSLAACVNTAGCPVGQVCYFPSPSGSGTCRLPDGRITAEDNNGIDDDNNGFIDDTRGWNFIVNSNVLNLAPYYNLVAPTCVTTPQCNTTFLETCVGGHCTQTSVGAAGAWASHGTAVTSHVVGATNNALGSAGSAFAARAVSLVIQNPTGGSPDSSVATIAGWNYIITLKNAGLNIRAVNMPVGFASRDPDDSNPSNHWSVGETMMNRLARAGIPLFASSGNGSRNIDIDPQYPASWSVNHNNVVAATGLDRAGQVINQVGAGPDPFGNITTSPFAWGPRTVAIAAYVNTISANTTNILGVRNSGFQSSGGTSNAAAELSSITLALAAQTPALTYSQIITRINSTAVPSIQLDGIVSTGGIANAYRALNNITSVDPNTGARFATCATNADCCSGIPCTIAGGDPTGICSCRDLGQTCDGTHPCCPQRAIAGATTNALTCLGGRCTCAQNGQSCSGNIPCCNGSRCLIPTGQLIGTCSCGGLNQRMAANTNPCCGGLHLYNRDPANLAATNTLETVCSCAIATQFCSSDATCCAGLQCVSNACTGSTTACARLHQHCTPSQTCCAGFTCRWGQCLAPSDMSSSASGGSEEGNGEPGAALGAACDNTYVYCGTDLNCIAAVCTAAPNTFNAACNPAPTVAPGPCATGQTCGTVATVANHCCAANTQACGGGCCDNLTCVSGICCPTTGQACNNTTNPCCPGHTCSVGLCT